MDDKYTVVDLRPHAPLKYYNVILKSIDNNPENITNKLRTIRVIRQLNPEINLVDAKYVVEHTPYTLGEYVAEDVAENAKEALEEHGCVVELQLRGEG